jgi:hypothetical protein
VFMIFSIQPSADLQSLVAPHWLAALGATVNPLTDCTQIRHFVMAITIRSTRRAHAVDRRQTGLFALRA